MSSTPSPGLTGGNPDDGNNNNQHSEKVLKKFNLAVKKVERLEHGGKNKRKIEETDEEEVEQSGVSLTEEELIGLIRKWEPTRDIICLYVRWGRQLRKNFNLDSIATLLCVSCQCDYTPFDFIRKVKTLSMHLNAQTTCGVTFHYAIVSNSKDVDEEKLSKEFLGLSVTLSLLQEQVTESPSILGKTGMQQKGPRTAKLINVPIMPDNPSNANPDHCVMAHPNVEFHKEDSLTNRIWLSINHRWAALFLTDHIFEKQSSSLESLVYSFQMMAPCGPGRYEFLSPLFGYCIRFPTEESIKSNRKKLNDIQQDPSLFFKKGNEYSKRFTSEIQAKIIVECFNNLILRLTRYNKATYCRKTPWSTKWNMLRGYIFHFWLESSTNTNIKDMVSQGLSKRKKKQQQSVPSVFDKDDNSSLPLIPEGIEAQPLLRDTEQRPRNPPSWLTQEGAGASVHTAEDPHQSRSLTDVVAGEGESLIRVDDRVDTTSETGTVGTQPVKQVKWSSMRLISESELEEYVKSYLVIRRNDGSDIVSELSPLEVYLANNLHDLVHCRMSAKPPFFPSKKNRSSVTLRVDADAESYLDISGKSFYITRRGSTSFDEHLRLLPCLTNIHDVCRAIVEHGIVDEKRATGQYRMNIGNGGLNWVDGAPCKLHGMKFEEALKADRNFNVAEVLETIGNITEFTWHVASTLQEEAADHPMAPDDTRKQMYAQHLNDYLSMGKEVGFEDLTLVVSCLHPVIHSVSDHKDGMNDTLSGYTRTVAFNMVMMNDNRKNPTIIHFQIIGNFRKVVGDYVLSFGKFISPIANHARQYIDKWNRSIYQVYAGRTKSLPTVYQRSAYYLDDTLPYTKIRISENGKHKETYEGEYLLMEVGVSRTLSLSMFIDPIVKLKGILKTDQMIELALACSYLSNPFWFDWTMSALLQGIEDKTFQFQLHPFYDWSQETIKIFGTWQGGPHNRWSPCGGSKETILETFGAQPTATKEEREQGEWRLTKIISILWDHVLWINSMEGTGASPTEEMPLQVIRKRYDTTVKRIAEVTACQFSNFRLGILTTILLGCGLLKPGRHLRHLMFPVKGTASYKHLSDAIPDVMSSRKAYALGTNERDEVVCNDGEGSVSEEDHDCFMRHLSSELGFKVYCRDEMECILCKSHPMRSLCCRDWFRKGSTLYDCNTEGEFFRKDYGKYTEWVKMNLLEYTFAFIGVPTFWYVADDPLLSGYAFQFGTALRSKESAKTIILNGRTSKTSGNNVSFNNNSISDAKFCHTKVQTADFYVGSSLNSTGISSLFILGDGENAVATSGCNNFEHFRQSEPFLDYLHTLSATSTSMGRVPPLAAARYHRDPDVCAEDEVSFFPGHIDKAFVHCVCFVPVGSAPFFTIIAVPRHFDVTQDDHSMKLFNKWFTTLSLDSRRKVDEFVANFDAQAKRLMRDEGRLDRRLFYNKCGSVLSFPANLCYHATITPKRAVGTKRDLLIFHPLDGIGGPTPTTT